MKRFMKKSKTIYNAITHPYVQITIGWTMVIFGLIGWPSSALTVAREEPPVILGISWLAIIFAGYSVVAAGHADLRTLKQDI